MNNRGFLSSTNSIFQGPLRGKERVFAGHILHIKQEGSPEVDTPALG